MSQTLTALLPVSHFSATGGAYEVSGTVGTYASTWKHRFRMYPVVVTGLTGTTLWRVQTDDGAFLWPLTPVIDSTGTTAAVNLGNLDVFGLAQGQILHARARLENTPSSPISVGTCTISTGSPMVVTKSTHGLEEGDVVRFTTSGALPGPLVVGTSYYIRYVDANTFRLAATEGGTAINFTSGAGSGTHTLTLYKAVSAWQTLQDDDFATGAVLSAVPTFSTLQIRAVQIFPVSTTAALVAWNNYPQLTDGDIVGSSVVVGPALGSGFAGVTVDGLDNFASLILSGYSDGDEINVEVYPLIRYPTLLGVFTATGGDAIATAYPTDPELRATASGIVGTPNDLTPLAGPATVLLARGVPAAATWQYLGSGATPTPAGLTTPWSLVEAPAGLAISSPSPGQRLGVLGGAPTEEGIFYGRVCCVSVVGFTRTVSQLAVTFAVGGALCLPWLHTDPLAVDLQFLQRDRTVASYRFPAGTVSLTRGDTVPLWAIFRAGPVSPTSNGPVLDPTLYKRLTLTVRPAQDLDGEPYLELEAALALAIVATFTADASTELLTFVAAHGLQLGDKVRVSNSGGGLPAGLAAATDYFVIASGLTTTALKVSATRFGSAINITTAGTGTHTLSTYRVACTSFVSGGITYKAIPLPCEVASPALDQAFDSLDLAPGASASELALTATGELTYLTPDGTEISSRPIAFEILQDVAR